MAVVEWTIVKALGSGFYGQVQLGRLPNEHLLAVKSCVYSRSSSIRKELHILRQFGNCDKIVKCYGDAVSTEKGEAFYNLFLEYAPAGTLLDLIKGYGGTIRDYHVKCYTKMLLEGLQCIHAKGYIHCDLKPDNIFVFSRCNSYVTLKITDFGLVRQAGENYALEEGRPKKLKFTGTLCYMSPETIIRCKISHALYIWSLGCIVLQIITGKRPWEGMKSKMNLAIEMLSSRNPPNKIPKTLSSECKDFLMKCFAKEPTERWSADVVLTHPFITTTTQDKSVDCLLTMEELEEQRRDFL